ncbi:MAG: hypothetical protein ABI230_13955 [Aestuariivirga sp.]
MNKFLFIAFFSLCVATPAMAERRAPTVKDAVEISGDIAKIEAVLQNAKPIRGCDGTKSYTCRDIAVYKRMETWLEISKLFFKKMKEGMDGTYPVADQIEFEDEAVHYVAAAEAYSDSLIVH